MRRNPVDQHLAHLKARNLRPNTIIARRDHLRRLAHALDAELDETLLAATRDDLLEWQMSMSHLSPNYRSNATAHVRAFYRWAMQAELLDRDPSITLASVRTPQTLPRPIGEGDLDMAIRCAPDRVRCMLVLAAYEGLRACEIAGLIRQDVLDSGDPPVLFVTGKGGRQRVIPLSERSLMELRMHGLPARGFIFPRGDGQVGGNSPARVSQLCSQYLHEMGISDTLHSLRHRFGSQMYAVSSDLRMTQEVLGHATPSTTAGYVAWSSAAAAVAVTRLPGAALTASSDGIYPGDVRSSA